MGGISDPSYRRAPGSLCAVPGDWVVNQTCGHNPLLVSNHSRNTGNVNFLAAASCLTQPWLLLRGPPWLAASLGKLCQEKPEEIPGVGGESRASEPPLPPGRAVLGGAGGCCCIFLVFLVLPPGAPAPGAVLCFLLFREDKCNWTGRECSSPKADKRRTKSSFQSSFFLKKKKKKKG